MDFYKNDDDCFLLQLVVIGFVSYMVSTYFLKQYRKSMTSDMTLRWFDIENVAADNNCMFHAILAQISEDLDTAQNISSMRQIIEDTTHELHECFQTDTRNMANSTKWGNEIGLAILANRLNLCFVVYRTGTFQLISNATLDIYSKKTYRPRACLKIIFLYNDDRARHFQILHPSKKYEKCVKTAVKKLWVETMKSRFPVKALGF